MAGGISGRAGADYGDVERHLGDGGSHRSRASSASGAQRSAGRRRDKCRWNGRCLVPSSPVQVNGVDAGVGTVFPDGRFDVTVTALVAGQVVTATQTMFGLTSLHSASVMVRARPPAPTVTSPLVAGSIQVLGTGCIRRDGRSLCERRAGRHRGGGFGWRVQPRCGPARGGAAGVGDSDGRRRRNQRPPP